MSHDSGQGSTVVVADPEMLAGLPDAASIDDEPSAEAPVAGEGAPESAEDSIEQQWQSEQIQERHKRGVDLRGRKLVQLQERAIRGDAAARAELAQTAIGQRALALLDGSVVEQVQQQLPGEVDKAREFTRLASLKDENFYAYQQECRERPGLDSWVTTDYPRWLASQQQVVATRHQPATSALESFIEGLRADDDAPLLIEADWDDLDPALYDDLRPAVAQRRIVQKFDLLVAKRRARALAAPVEARAERVEQTAAAVRAAMREAPPPVGGRVSGAADLETLADAYINNPRSPQARSRYEAAARAAGVL